MLAAVGVSLIAMHTVGMTEISIFGLRFRSSNVGIAAIFLAAGTVTFVMTTLLKRLKELGALPPDANPWRTNLL